MLTESPVKTLDNALQNRNTLATTHWEWARRYAINFALAKGVQLRYGPVSRDDIESAAADGLIAAAKHYQPQLNDNFRAFAKSKVQWEVLERIRTLLESRRRRPKLKRHSLADGQAIDDRRPEHDLDTSDQIRSLISHVESRDRALIVESYLNQKTMKEVGQQFGLSESRVCARIRDAIKSIRETVATDLEL